MSLIDGADGLISSAAHMVTQAVNNAYSMGSSGSAMANNVSQQAQAAQMAYNSDEAYQTYLRSLEMMQQQQAYNSGAAANQYDFNREMWQASADFNAAQAQLQREWATGEAQKNRDFQYMMSSTAYQRAVKDLQTAGLNPILAAMGSGAATTSGSTVSGSTASTGVTSGGMASAGIGSSGQASASTYTGQGHNMSETLALVGAMASMLGQGMSGLAESNNMLEAADIFTDEIIKKLEEGKKTLGDTKIGKGIKDLIGDFRTWNYSRNADKEYGSWGLGGWNPKK